MIYYAVLVLLILFTVMLEPFVPELHWAALAQLKIVHVMFFSGAFASCNVEWALFNFDPIIGGLNHSARR